MALPDGLVSYRFRGAGGRSVHRHAAGVWSLVGAATFGAAEAFSPAWIPNIDPRVIQFRDDLFALSKGRIHRYNSGTNVWDLMFDTSDLGHAHFGPKIIFNSALETEELVFAQISSTVDSSLIAYSSLDGVTWTPRASSSLQEGTTTNGFGQSFVYRNLLFCPSTRQTNTGNISAYDRTLNAWTDYTLPGLVTPLGRDVSFCTFEGRLLAFCYPNNTGNNPPALFELTGSFFVKLQDLGVGFNTNGVTLFTSGNRAVGAAMFVDGGNVYVVYGGGTDVTPTVTGNGGTIVSKLVKTGGSGTVFTETDKTAATVPLAFLGADWAGGTNPANRWPTWAVFIDTNTAPATPAIYLALRQANGAGTSINGFTYFFAWNGDASLMTDEGNVAEGFGLPHLPNGGGELTWTNGEFNIQIVKHESVSGGIKLHVMLFGDPAGPLKKAEFRFSKDEQTPVSQCTLFGTPTVISGPAAAPTRTGNQILGLEADDTSVYGIFWDNVTDAVPELAYVHLKPSIVV